MPIPVCLIDPLTVNEPDIVWFALNWLDPVVANELVSIGVTPGIPVNPLPSPLKEPVKDPVV